MVGLKRGTVTLEEYQATWADWFIKERDRLMKILGEAAGPFEHVGSTAVPGLAAKPIIDFMAGVASMEEARKLIPLLEAHGYEYRPSGDLPDRILLVLGPPELRQAHFSLVVQNSAEWQNLISFRDYLRTHPEARQDYSELKCRLAHSFAQDRPSYTAGKEKFILEIISRFQKT
jgi:GrpB-like predicted nucleotidyltransferase (UPF0157 family)